MELAKEINHSSHPQHPLVYLSEPPSPQGYYVCNFCRRTHWGPVYHCAACDFSLDISCCASRHLADDHTKLKHFSHEHPLVLIEKHDDDVPAFCFGCDERLSGSIYRCLQCNNFDLHKQCAELDGFIFSHALHPRHQIQLLQFPPDHVDACTCDVCENHYQGFVYVCLFPDCGFSRPVKDFFKSFTVPVGPHEHEIVTLQRKMSFICDICGIPGDRDPCICGTCQILIHESCISLPEEISTYGHRHPISLLPPSSSIYTGSKQILLIDYGFGRLAGDCHICHKRIDPQYWYYYCRSSFLCFYAVHAKCAIDTTTQDGGDVPMESKNLISAETDSEIKHAYHKHKLILTNDVFVNGDNICHGCMRPKSLLPVPFYSCEQCRAFSLHKDCAELPRQIRFRIHKHLLTLTKNGFTRCDACGHYHHGFSYKCDRRRCNFKIDLQCGLLPTTLNHPSHPHRLSLDRNHAGDCSGCGSRIPRRLQNGAYRCRPCGYALDFKCIRLPHSVWYKHDEHGLTLTCHDSSDPDQRYCDICEEEREPDSWFYHCEQCDNSVHIDCIVGDLPFVKLRSRFRHETHPHSLTFLRKIWNCPPCSVCGKICNTHALECREIECKFIVHWKCLTFEVENCPDPTQLDSV